MNFRAQARFLIKVEERDTPCSRSSQTFSKMCTV